MRDCYARNGRTLLGNDGAAHSSHFRWLVNAHIRRSRFSREEHESRNKAHSPGMSGQCKDSRHCRLAAIVDENRWPQKTMTSVWPSILAPPFADPGVLPISSFRLRCR